MASRSNSIKLGLDKRTVLRRSRSFSAIGDDAPQHIGAIEIVLHQRVRAASVAAFPVELLIAGDDVDRAARPVGA